VRSWRFGSRPLPSGRGSVLNVRHRTTSGSEWLLAILLCALTGCGYVGDPLPPALHIPEKVTDLRAVQRGDRILIDFTIPELTTEGLPIRKVGGIDLRVGTVEPPFNVDRWMSSAKAVPVPVTERKAQALAQASEWYGRDVVIGVRVLNHNNRPSDWSNFAVVTAITPLATPTQLRAEMHPKGILVKWAAETRDQVQFRVFRRADDQKADTVIATVLQPEYLDGAVTLGKRYEYSVRAVIGSAESETAGPASVLARDVFAPATPAGLTAVASLNSIELGWERNAEQDLASYRVYRAEADSAFTIIADSVDNPAFSDRQVSSGKIYRYAVTALDQAGNESEKTPPVQAAAP
jgi:hypothetical protein